MRYTIEGFSQEYAITLRKNILSNGKEKLIKIDCTDLVILRWFVDFYPNMRKMIVDGQEYAILVHSYLAEDMPLLDISKRACIERMQKLVEFGILKYRLLKEGGTFSLYTFGENYIYLLRSNVDGMQSNNTGSDGQNAEGVPSSNTGGTRSNSTGAYGQPANKDTFTNTPNTNNPNTNEEKKESKQGSFDAILSEYTNDFETLGLLKEWLKVRKAKRAAMTDLAIQMNIDKLDELAQASEMSVKEYLCEVIRKGWAAFYEIKQYNKPASTRQPVSTGGNIFLQIGKEQGSF